MLIGGFVGMIVLIWLLIGVVAAGQRDYFRGRQTSCATAETIALTTLSGPVDYARVMPVVSDYRLPQPSSMGALGSIG